jgi:hypothetical protein
MTQLPVLSTAIFSAAIRISNPEVDARLLLSLWKDIGYCAICDGRSGTGAPNSVSSFYQCSLSGVRQAIPIGDGFDAVHICTKTLSPQSGYELDDIDVTMHGGFAISLPYCSKNTFYGHCFFRDKGGHSITNSTRIPLLILARFHSFVFHSCCDGFHYCTSFRFLHIFTFALVSPIPPPLSVISFFHLHLCAPFHIILSPRLLWCPQFYIPTHSFLSIFLL